MSSILSTVFVRVVTQDRDRGFMLLVGFDAKVVQSTATQLISLSGLTRDSLTATIERVKKTFNASEIRDVTNDGIKRRLRILFNEPAPLTAKQIELAAKREALIAAQEAATA